MPFLLTLGDGKVALNTFVVTLTNKAGVSRDRTFIYDPTLIGQAQVVQGTIPLDRTNLPVGSTLVFEPAPTPKVGG
jgi:hypothetical protein